MLEYDFHESIGYWLSISAHALQKGVGDDLAQHGITFRQCQVLGWLAHDGEMSQTDLAGRMMIEPPTLVRILDRMERDGWIERRDCADDRRKKMIRPTTAAEPVWQKVVGCFRRARARATEGFEPKEVEQLKRLLERLHANLVNEAAHQPEAQARLSANELDARARASVMASDARTPRGRSSEDNRVTTRES